MRLDLVGERVELEEPRRLGPLLEERGGRTQEVKVALHLLPNAGPPDLDDHLAPVLQQRRVDLRDRGRGERLGVDARERLLSDGVADRALDPRERDRRNLVGELGELVDVDVGKQVGARRQQLPELHEGGAELLECRAELARALTRRGTVADEADLAEHAQQALAPGDLGHLERTPPSVETSTHRVPIPASRKE